METVSNFFTNTLFGVILCSIIASLLATLLYKMVERRIKVHHAKSIFYDKAFAFMLGARAAMAKTSSYKQILLVGDYIIDIMRYSLRIILYAFIAVIMVVLLRNGILWGLPIIISAFFITFDLLKINQLRKYYEQNVELIFGKDYLDREFESAIDFAKNGKVSENSEVNEHRC